MIKKSTSRKLYEARSIVMGKMLNWVRAFRNYNGIAGAEDFDQAKKMLDQIKSAGAVCNTLYQIRQVELDEEARLNGLPTNTATGTDMVTKQIIADAAAELKKIGKGLNS